MIKEKKANNCEQEICIVFDRHHVDCSSIPAKHDLMDGPISNGYSCWHSILLEAQSRLQMFQIIVQPNAREKKI